jgi:hypothetical protein
VKADALGVQWKNGNRERQRCKNEARHRTPVSALTTLLRWIRRVSFISKPTKLPVGVE